MAADDLDNGASRRGAGVKASLTKGAEERTRAAKMAAWTREHGKDDDRNPHSRQNGGARYILKPVFWNTAGYRRPSGVVSASGYTAEKGYGHEEWNNSRAMAFEEAGERFRAFHTEGVGSLPVEASAERLFVFMCASHDGVQELVGVAGGATCLVGDEGRRAELARRLDLDKLWRDAWALERVRALHGGDHDRFLRSWRDDLNWIPNWTCPARLFFWPERPVRLDAMRIRGTSKLLTMFGRYTALSPEEARAILDMVPDAARTEAWSELARVVGADGGRTSAGSSGYIAAGPSGGEVPQASRAPTAWIFQAQPLRFRVDEFLSRKPATFHWLATTHADEIEPGDRVYIWRAIGGGLRDESGVFAEAVVEEPARPRPEPEDERAFWVDEADRSRVVNRVVLRLVRAVDKGRLLKRRWIEDDPLLSDLTILDSPRRTNYRLTDAQAARLAALWEKFDRAWDRAETVAALCVFERAGGPRIEKAFGSLCAEIAATIGRAVADVQSHARTFAEIASPTTRAGLGIGTALDRQTWADFFDPVEGRLRGEPLWDEYRRLWEGAGAVAPPGGRSAREATLLSPHPESLVPLHVSGAPNVTRGRAPEPPTGDPADDLGSSVTGDAAGIAERRTIEDEYAAAARSHIAARARREIDRDLSAAGAMEGLTEEQKVKVRVRVAWLADRFVHERRHAGTFVCDACGFDPEARAAGTGVSPRSLMDVHHRDPLAEGKRITTVADFQLLCPNCHRFEHASARVPLASGESADTP